MIFSLDVVALYPSIMRGMAMEAISKAIERSDIRWEQVNTKWLSRYVAMTRDRKEINRLGLGEVVPHPKGKTTFRSYSAPRDNAKTTDGDSQFTGETRRPSQKETRRLIGLMAATTVELCMRSHFYTIGGNIRVQSEGGAIGSDLTGETSKVVMNDWDSRFLRMIKKFGIKLDLYRRHVDDIVILTPHIKAG